MRLVFHRFLEFFRKFFMYRNWTEICKLPYRELRVLVALFGLDDPELVKAYPQCFSDKREETKVPFSVLVASNLYYRETQDGGQPNIFGFAMSYFEIEGHFKDIKDNFGLTRILVRNLPEGEQRLIKKELDELTLGFQNVICDGKYAVARGLNLMQLPAEWDSRAKRHVNPSAIIGHELKGWYDFDRLEVVLSSEIYFDIEESPFNQEFEEEDEV